MTDAASDNAEIAALSDLMAGARRIVALTGAGISTESGIPDFRSPGGLWSRIRPITYQQFVNSEAARIEDWRRRFVMNEAFARAEPNAGHRALALAAEQGCLDLVITQNIDGLHQRAGLDADRLIEIHGNATHGRCLDCRAPMPLPQVRLMIEASGASPRCACGGLVKAAVISFGESLSEPVLREAFRRAMAADLFLVIGSSLLVQPAATLPLKAERSGAALVIVNRDPTPLDSAARLIVRGSIGEAFSRLYPQLVNKGRGNSDVWQNCEH